MSDPEEPGEHLLCKTSPRFPTAAYARPSRATAPRKHKQTEISDRGQRTRSPMTSKRIGEVSGPWGSGGVWGRAVLVREKGSLHWASLRCPELGWQSVTPSTDRIDSCAVSFPPCRGNNPQNRASSGVPYLFLLLLPGPFLRHPFGRCFMVSLGEGAWLAGIQVSRASYPHVPLRSCPQTARDVLIG